MIRGQLTHANLFATSDKKNYIKSSTDEQLTRDEQFLGAILILKFVLKVIVFACAS